MRLRIRAAAFLALVFAGITCGESATAPKSSAGLPPARLSIAPQFSPEAQRAYGVLAAANAEITEIHVVLTGPDGSRRDTVIAFPPGQNVATIDIDVPPGSDGHPFTALIELRSADHTVLFAGTQVVYARSSGSPLRAPSAVLINYTGPGRTIRTVTVSPRDTTVRGTPTIAYTATAVDSGGAPVPNLLVSFTSSDATVATATSTGNATASVLALGKRGATTITARTPLGVTGNSVLSVVPPVSRLVVISGGGQSALAGSQLPLPFVVEAQAADNLPVPGTSISFRSVTAGGSVAQTAPRITDAAGRASVIMTLGTIAGAFQFEAAAPGLTPVTVMQTATAGTPTTIAIFAGNLQSDIVGRVLPQPLVARVTDQFGGPVSGATVRWARVNGSGAVSAASTTTAGDGTASITYTLGAAPGSEVVAATLQGGGTVLFGATATLAGVGSITVVTGGGQTGAPNSVLALPLVVRVEDAGGVPRAGQVVTFTSSPNGATFSPASITTNASGIASTAVTLGATLGAVTLTATSGTLSVSTGAAIAVGAAASITKVAGDLQTASVSTAVGVAPSVVVKDAGGNAVPNAPVVFAVALGGGSATGLSTTTNASGVATVGSWTLGSAIGANSLTATSGALSTTFSATAVAGTGSILVLAVSPSAAVVSGVTMARQPIVQLRDAFGNDVATAGVVVTASITSGSGTLANATATTASNGAATFSALTASGPLGPITITFSAPSYAPVPVGPVVIAAGAANVIALSAGNNQTTSTNTAVAVPPAVLVTDATGNPVAGTNVTFDVVTAGAQISNGTTTGSTVVVATNVSGIAALASWTLGSTVSPYVLHASAPLIGSPVVFRATAIASTGSQMVFVTPPPASATSGVALAPQPVVQLKDASGNNVATAGVVITASLASGTGSLINVTATTTAGGSATFSALTISGLVGSHTLSFSSPGVAPLTSAPIALVAGPANSMTIIAGNNQTSVAGAPVPVAPAVLVRDSDLNPVAGVVVTFDAGTTGAQISNTTTSGTTLTVTTNASGIAALTSWTLGPVPTQYALAASAAVPNGSPLTFTANATVGAASQLSLAVQPPSTAQIGVALVPQPVIQLKDANGNNVATAGVVVSAVISAGGTLVNASATTAATGAATFSGLGFTGATGTFTLQFASTGFANLTFGTIAVSAGAPSAIALNAGNNQSATVSTAVPVVPSVRVTDASGNPVAGTVVTFAVITAGSTVSDASSTGASVTVPTNALGIASLTAWTLGSQAGAYSMIASAPGLLGSPVAFTATAVAGTGSVLAFVQAPAVATTSGAVLGPQPIVQLKDAQGNNVTTSGVVVSAQITSGTGSLTGAAATTNAGGTATFTALAITGTAGNFSLQFSAPGFGPLPFSPIAVGAGAASTIALSAGNSQTAAVSTAVPVAPAVLVTDASGNAVSGVQVTFAVVTAGATVSNGTSTGSSVTVATNASGVATLTAWTLGTVAQPYTMTASAGGLSGSPVTFNATAAAGAGTQLVFSQQPSVTTTSGSPLAVQPIVQLKDAQGNNVVTPGVTVTATISSGTGTLANAQAVTNSAGTATFSGLAITGGSGSFTLQFAAPGYSNLLSSPIALSAGTGVALKFVTPWAPGPTAALSIFSPTPSVQVVDANGNAVAVQGVSVQAAIATGPGTPAPSINGALATTNASGVASFPGLSLGGATGTYTLTFTATSLTPVTSGNVVITAGAGTTLTSIAGNGLTAQVLTAVPTAPSARLTDQFGNPVPNQTVTFRVLDAGSVLASGSTTSSTSVTVQTDAAGAATLTSWTLGATAKTYSISVAFQGAVTIFFGATAVPGPAASIALNAGDNQSGPAGFSLPIPPSVVVRDAQGNGVGGAVVQFTIVTPGATVSNGSVTTTTAPVTTNAGSGIAQLNAWTLGPVAQTYTMTASLSGVSGSPVTFTATGTASAAASIIVNAGNNQSATVSTNVATAPSVLVRDPNTNPVAGTVVTFTVQTAGAQIANTSSSGTTLTVTSGANGIAALTSWTMGPLAQQSVLTASASGLQGSPVTFTATAVAGPASIMLLEAGNAQSTSVGSAVPIPPAVRVMDAQSNGVAGTVVTFSVVTAGGQVQNSTTISSTSVTVTTNASGIAALTNYFVGTTPQNYTLTASASGLSGSPITFTETAVAGPATHLTYTTAPSGSAQSGVALATQPRVQLRDAAGNAAVATPGLTIVATVTSGNGTLSNATAVTDGAGQATFTGLTISGTAGQFVLAFKDQGNTLTGLSANVTLSAGPPTQLGFAAAGSTTVAVDTLFAASPRLQLLDSQNNNVSQRGVLIRATVLSGGGTLSVDTATTDGSGIATFAGLRIIGPIGTYLLSYSSPGFTSVAGVPIAVTVGVPRAVAVSSGAGQTATGGEAVPVAPAFKVVDAGNNGISGQSVFFNTVPTNSQITNASTCCNNLTVVTNANGVATLVSWTLSSTPATNTLTGSVPALPSLGSASMTATGVASNSNSLSIVARPTTPVTSGAPLSPQPTLQLRNAQGQSLAVANVPVTAFVVVGSSTSATISGTTTVFTNASGLATFTNLVITGPSGSMSLRFRSPGYTGTLMGVSIP